MLYTLASSILEFFHHILNLCEMEITTGCEYWKGKPKFAFVYMYYDGPHYIIHIGPYWIEWDYNYD